MNLIRIIKNWMKLVRFVLKYRNVGIPNFKLITNSEYIIVYVIDKQKGIYDQIKLRYK
jgi:hypothetical protein